MQSMAVRLCTPTQRPPGGPRRAAAGRPRTQGQVGGAPWGAPEVGGLEGRRHALAHRAPQRVRRVLREQAALGPPPGHLRAETRGAEPARPAQGAGCAGAGAAERVGRAERVRASGSGQAG